MTSRRPSTLTSLNPELGLLAASAPPDAASISLEGIGMTEMIFLRH
jgi:hypothetical protein